MALRRLVADDLIEEVRQQLDEDNRETLRDAEDILPALNRGQDFASNILARHYESPLLKTLNLPLVAGQQEYDIPEDAFEQRLEKVEVVLNSTYTPLKAISYRDISYYESPSNVNIPYYYCIVGNKFRIVPAPSGTYGLRLWYLRDPAPLVKQQGRITNINTTSNYVTVDSLGDDVSTDIDALESFLNIVDGESGNIKASLQVQSIAGNRVTFKTVPSRTAVLGKSIVGTLVGADVEKDDYICLVEGNCVPYLKKPLANFLIQYAVAELTRKLGGPADMEERVKKDLEEQVERSWVGREQTLRVKKVSRHWSYPARRYYSGS